MPDANTSGATIPSPSHLKIALTTNDLTRVDADFPTARQFVFYSVSSETSEFVDCVQFKERTRGGGEGSGEKKGGGRCCSAGAPAPAIGNSIDARIDALRGTAVLFTLAMSDPQLVRVAELGTFPVKLASARSILEVVDRLQEMLRGTPPLWLQRAMRAGLVEPVA